jgi:transcriptional regulator with XRE-family HTH domain
MWLDNLKELKKKSGLTCAEIAERSNVAERTVKRIFAGESDHPYADTLDMIVKALDADLGAVFSDTSVVVATADIVDIKDKVETVTAEAEMLIAENNALKLENTALKSEVDLLRLKLEHQAEIIALHNYYMKREASSTTHAE